MLLKVNQLDTLTTYANKANVAEAKGLVIYSVKDTRTGGLVTGGRTSGFKPQKTINVLLQTEFGSVYFHDSFQDKVEAEQTIRDIEKLESLYTLLEVAEVQIDRNKLIGSFKTNH